MTYYRRYSCLSRPAAILLVTALSVITVCCTSIKTDYADLSPEIKEVQAWKVVWAGDTIAADSRAIREIEGSFKSKFARKEYYAEYLYQLAEQLRGLGYHVIDEDIPVAIIQVAISGTKWTEVEYLDSDANSIQDFRRRHHQDDPGPSGGDDAIAPIVLCGDDVTSVSVRLSGADGTSLGAIDISGDKITPEKAAGAIDKVIREGE